MGGVDKREASYAREEKLTHPSSGAGAESPERLRFHTPYTSSTKQTMPLRLQGNCHDDEEGGLSRSRSQQHGVPGDEVSIFVSTPNRCLSLLYARRQNAGAGSAVHRRRRLVSTHAVSAFSFYMTMRADGAVSVERFPIS